VGQKDCANRMLIVGLAVVCVASLGNERTACHVENEGLSRTNKPTVFATTSACLGLTGKTRVERVSFDSFQSNILRAREVMMHVSGSVGNMHREPGVDGNR
jgi:hypothetical protein